MIIPEQWCWFGCDAIDGVIKKDGGNAHIGRPVVIFDDGELAHNGDVRVGGINGESKGVN